MWGVWQMAVSMAAADNGTCVFFAQALRSGSHRQNTLLPGFSSSSGFRIKKPILQIRELRLVTGSDLFEVRPLGLQILGPEGFGFKSLPQHICSPCGFGKLTIPP